MPPGKAMDRLEAEIQKLRAEYEVMKSVLPVNERLEVFQKVMRQKLDLITDEIKSLRASTCAVYDSPHRKIGE